MTSKPIPRHLLHIAPGAHWIPVNHSSAFPNNVINGPRGTLCLSLYNSAMVWSALTIRGTWLFIDDPCALPKPIEQMQAVFTCTYNRNFTICSLDKRILQWALAVHAPHIKVSTDQMFEMRLSFPSRVLGLWVPLTTVAKVLGMDGYEVMEDPEWFRNFKPDNSAIVNIGGQRVFVVVAHHTQERAVYLTVLMDKGGTGNILITGLHTFPAWRRKGLGRLLVSHVQELHATGSLVSDEKEFVPVPPSAVRVVWVTVPCDDVPAVNMFQQLGYKINRSMWVVKYDETAVKPRDAGLGVLKAPHWAV